MELMKAQFSLIWTVWEDQSAQTGSPMTKNLLTKGSVRGSVPKKLPKAKSEFSQSFRSRKIHHFFIAIMKKCFG